MARVRRCDPIPRKIVEDLIVGTAPEQIEEMQVICQKYDPKFFIADDAAGATLQANSERVLFDNKTLTVYWLLSFAGWRTLECYSPAVMCSLPPERLACLFNLDPQLVAIIFPPGTTIAEVLARDSNLHQVETGLSEKIRLARSILHSGENDASTWPEDIPPLGAPRESLEHVADQATFDLAVMSTAYAFCHELRHIMFAKDGLYTNNPDVDKKEARASRPEEELACDVWARDFLTSRIGVYAKQHNLQFDRVLAKRSIAAAIGIFVLYETTERIGDAGDEVYPPLADRLNATLQDTALSSTNNFWVVYACVLLAILRRRNRTPAIRAQDAKQLCERLVEEIRQSS